MEDLDFIRGFETATLQEFHHRDHVRVAWLYLKRDPVLVALSKFTTGLKRFAASKGVPGLYHETITWAYLLLIRERMARRAPDATWEEFSSENPDLLTWRPSILETYYRAETLRSDLAREVFVMPDR